MFLSLSDILVSLEKACSIPYIEIHCKHPTYMDKDFLFFMFEAPIVLP